jgi:hypothetical protein
MACQLVQAFEPQWISTYTLCLKRGAKFVPNYFSLLIHDWDRALFWLERIPVNRLAKGVHDKNVQLRLLENNDDIADLNRKDFADGGVDVCISFENLFLNPSCKCVNYVCSQNNALYGHLAFQWVGDKDTGIGCRIQKIKMVHGANLNVLQLFLRWTETCARHRCCGFIELKCIEPNIRRRLIELGFKPVGDSGVLRREILHLIKTLTAFPDDDYPGHIFHQL